LALTNGASNVGASQAPAATTPAATLSPANGAGGGTPVTNTGGNPNAGGTVGASQLDPPSLTIVRYGLVYDRQTHLWSGTVKITNSGNSAYTGPLFLVLTKLNSGAVLENANGTYGGDYYLKINVGTVAPGQTTTAVVTFNQSPVSFTPVYYIGSLGG
jgi:hypothetical protein